MSKNETKDPGAKAIHDVLNEAVSQKRLKFPGAEDGDLASDVLLVSAVMYERNYIFYSIMKRIHGGSTTGLFEEDKTLTPDMCLKDNRARLRQCYADSGILPEDKRFDARFQHLDKLAENFARFHCPRLIEDDTKTFRS